MKYWLILLYFSCTLRVDAFKPIAFRHTDSAVKAMTAISTPSVPGSVKTSNSLTRLKILALITLVLQNSGLTVAMRLSRVKKESSNLYITSTAVVVSEGLKTLISLFIYYLSNRSKDANIFQSMMHAKEDCFADGRDALRVAVPSGLYVIQNNLQYIATSNLPAEIYQVLIQMKLIVTALFSMKFMKKYQSLSQWICILFLSIGLALVQLSYKVSSSSHINLLVGLSSVFLCCLTSGFAGTYHEVTLKQKKVSLTVRNIQMSSISLIMALIGEGMTINDLFIRSFHGILPALGCGYDFQAISQVGFFHGYDPLVLGVIFLQAIGGLIISVVVKYTDSIVKGFATSASIIVACFLSNWLIKDFTMTKQFYIGATIVGLSAMFYSFSSIIKQEQQTQSPNEATKESESEASLHTQGSELSSNLVATTAPSPIPISSTSIAVDSSVLFRRSDE